MDPLTNTPQARIVQHAEDTLASRSSRVKEFVRDVSPTQSRCIIENSPCIGIQLCHVFGRANSIKDTLMSSIEYKWNIPFNSLNLDSRYNCFYCGSIFHGAYDHGQWCLMPERRTVTEYLEATYDQENRNRLSDLLQRDHDKGKYTYTVLGIDPAMKGKPIIKHKKDEPENARDLKLHVYPYNKPAIRIKSHLHPKFVILSIGHQLTNAVIKDEFLDQSHLLSYKADFRDIQELYGEWTKPVPIEKMLRHPRVAQEIIEESDDNPQPRAKKSKDNRSYSGRQAKDQDGLSVTTRNTRQSSLRMKALTDGGHSKETETAETSSVRSKQTANTAPRRIPIVRRKKNGGRKRMAEGSPSPSPPPSPTTQTTRVTRKSVAKKLRSDPVASSSS